MAAIDEILETWPGVTLDAPEFILQMEASGFVADVDNDQLIQQRLDWLVFTKSWIQLRRQLRKGVNYNPLAVAIANAHGGVGTWATYLEMARHYLALAEIDEQIDELVVVA